MDETPSLDDLSQGPDTFNKSPSLVPSTPITQISCRKRKFDESCPSTPKFSSTLNESLIVNLSDFHLENSPNTPEKQMKIIAKGMVMASPIQESRKILYGNIKIVKPEKKINSPLVKTNLRHNVFLGKQNLLRKILSIDIIMDVIFKYLSDGDLYRFSMVSSSFLKSLEKNLDAYNRYKVYKNIFQDNKENYVITPPASPEKCDSPPRSNSENFNKFIRIAKCINATQRLMKCRKCDNVAIVENGICQCQNLATCGLIYCLNCSSYSVTGPKDFKDDCGHAFLRPTLGNVSNCMDESFYSNTLNFSNTQDSGFYSENESPVTVKRKLFSNLNESTPKALAVCNKNVKIVNSKKRDAVAYVPVVVNKDYVKKSVECGESPPRYSGNYIIGSKQSKRNLKRLTR